MTIDDRRNAWLPERVRLKPLIKACEANAESGGVDHVSGL